MSKISNLYRLGLASLVSVGLISLMSACDLDGGGSSSSGGPSVEGNVVSFNGSQAYFVPQEEKTFLAAAVDLVLQCLVAEARAAVPGVVVSVQGTDIRGTTDGSGFFRLKGLPPGTQVLEFTFDGITGTRSITVPNKGEVVLTNIEVDDSGRVRVENIVVFEDDDSSEDDSSDEDSDDDSSDEASSDADSTDDDSL